MGQLDAWALLVDVDKTLLGRNGVPRRSIEALDRFVHKGGLFVPASGRPHESIRLVLDKCPAGRFNIALNGAILFDHETGTGSVSQPFQPGAAHALVQSLGRIVSRWGMCVYEDADWWIMGDSRLTHIEEDRSGLSPSERLSIREGMERLSGSATCGKLLGVVDPTEAQIAIATLQGSYSSDAEVASSYPEYIEITPAGVTKATPLATLIDWADAADRSLAVVGDASNDADLMRKANVSFAVSNATEQIRELADYVVGACEDGGVADVVEYLESL